VDAGKRFSSSDKLLATQGSILVQPAISPLIKMQPHRFVTQAIAIHDQRMSQICTVFDPEMRILTQRITLFCICDFEECGCYGKSCGTAERTLKTPGTFSNSAMSQQWNKVTSSNSNTLSPAGRMFTTAALLASSGLTTASLFLGDVRFLQDCQDRVSCPW
jgi:hypothetical protein